MQNTRLLALLDTLDRKECRELRKFIESPFFNLRKDVVLLFDYIITCRAQNLIPEKEQAFPQLYGKGEPYDDHKIRMAMSFLTKLTEQYLVQKEFSAQEARSKTILAGVLRKRNLGGHFDRTIREAQALQEASPHRNAEFFRDEFQIQLEQYRSTSAARRTGDNNLQLVSDNLDIAYFAQKLRQSCLVLSHQALYKKEYDFGILEAVLEHVRTKDLLNVPAISLYYYCYQALTQPETPAWFHHFKEQLMLHGEKFPAHEIADLYVLAVNICIKRYNDGSPEYLQDEFDLYKEGLKRSYFLNNGVLSRFTYRNVVTIGLVMREFVWVENFIQEFQDKLEKQYRESMFSFNMARLHYGRKNYKAALQLLQLSEYEDLLLNLAAKTVMLKIYFELDETDALASHLEAMRMFIRRKKIMGYHSEHYLATVHFTKKLMELEGFEKEERAALRQEILSAKAVAERDWLLEQVG